MSVYEQNLHALLEIESKLAKELMNLKTNEKFEVFVDKKDRLNINIAHSATATPIYDGIPIQQTEQLLESFSKNYSRYPFVYFYGMGNGVFYKALLHEAGIRKIVVVEPEIEILYVALHFNDFSADILSGKLVIMSGNRMSFAEASTIFSNNDSRIFSKTYQFHTLLPFYERHYHENILGVNKLFLQAIEHIVRELGNDSTDSLIGLQHHVANIDRMIETPTLVELIEKAKNSEVAVIVSAGPSLKKQLPLLKKIQNSVTIFCVDASFPILEREGIKPDVVISIERVIETAKFYKETSKAFQEDVIFSITSIAHPELFKEIKAGTLQVNMRPFGYTKYFNMPEYGYVGIGMSAANLAYEIIFHSSFKTCMLIGQDLAFGTDGSTHSEGHVYGSTETSQNKQPIYFIPAYGGVGNVKTTLVWRLFKNFFEADVSHGNAKGMKTVNATEGGARIEGTLEIPFADAIKRFVNTDFKKSKIILTKPSEEEIIVKKQKTQEKLSKMLSYAVKVQKEVESTFLKVAKECEILELIPVEKRYEQVDYQALHNVMQEIDIIKAYFDNQMFVDIFIDATQAMIIHQEMEVAKLQVRKIETDDDKRQKMIDWVLAHKYWLFSLAGMMQATIDAVNMGLEMKIDFESIECARVYVNDKEVDVLHVRHEDALINNLFDIKQMCINYVLDETHDEIANSVKFFYSNTEKSFEVEVHMPRKDDTHFNKFAFMNSLEATKIAIFDKCKNNVICFYGSEENINDNDFIEYTRELLLQYPEVIIQVLFFENFDKLQLYKLFVGFENRIKFINPNNIIDLYQSCHMYLSTKKTKIDLNIFRILRVYSNVVTVYYTMDLKNLLMRDAVLLCKSGNHPLLLDPEYFGYSRDELKSKDYNIYELLFGSIISDLAGTDNMYDLIYKRVMYKLLKDENFEYSYIKYARLEEKYVMGDKCRF